MNSERETRKGLCVSRFFAVGGEKLPTSCGAKRKLIGDFGMAKGIAKRHSFMYNKMDTI